MSRTSPGRIRRAMAEETQCGLQIVVAFQNYTPPFEAEKAVRRMLRYVPCKFLHGLHAIVLTNADALSHKERKRKTWGRHRVVLGEALGYYGREWQGEPARSTILVDSLERRWRRSGCGSGSFETCNYQRFSFTSWANTFITFTVHSTRARKMSRTNGANS